MVTGNRDVVDARPAGPAFSGHLGPNHERPLSGRGSDPKTFAQPSEVKEVFLQGIERLKERLETSEIENRVGGTIARVRLRSRAIAKSHRHPSLFDRNRFQVAGVYQPGDILALVTPQSILELTELVQDASERQITQLSAIAEITPYRASIEKGEHRSVLTLFDGILDDGTSLRSRGLEDLEGRGIELRRYGKMHNVFTASTLPSDEVLGHMPWLRGIRPVSRITTASRLGTQPIRPMSLGPISGVLPLPIIGVVDSGIDPSIAELQSLLVGRETHIPIQFSDRKHGSLVGALAATGGGFTPDPGYFPAPLARLLDVQILGSGQYETIDEDDLLIQIEDAVERYGPLAISRPNAVDEPVIIWNLSLGYDSAAPEDLFSAVAMELDRIAQENGVVFTVAAGNYQLPPLRGWQPGLGPDDIANGVDRISPPADAALAVAVGSLSDTSNPPTASPAEYPSPFSRRGPGPGMLVKPDVVHYGGTCGKYLEPVQGIRGPHRNGTALEDIGTSFAAPRVAAQLAELTGALPDPEPELLKLLLLLSCASRGDHDIENREMVNYYGFGFPESPVSLLSCNPWECMVLLRGELRPGLALQTPFPFPPSLTEGRRTRGFVRMGLVYAPFLDSSMGAEYCQTNITASLGRVFQDPMDGSLSYRGEIPPIPGEHGASAQFERDLIEHGWKWSPAKLYERTFTRMQATEIGWRLGVRLLLRRELEDRRDDVRQSFWLGIRIADPEERSPVYQEMHQRIQSMALAQPITLRSQISV